MFSSFSNFTRSLCCSKSCKRKHQRKIIYDHFNVKTTHPTWKDYEQQAAGAWEDSGEKHKSLSIFTPVPRQGRLATVFSLIQRSCSALTFAAVLNPVSSRGSLFAVFFLLWLAFRILK